jgi:hypothetical protein
MSRNKHLLLTPHEIRGNKHAWWYEETKGIEVIVHRDAINPGTGSAQLVIPWETIRQALARKDKK